MSLDVFIHSAIDELEFMRSTDYTCNLLDYRRDGYLVRDSPSVIEYDVSPYETVLLHINSKTLVPINIVSALQTARNMLDNGWVTEPGIIGPKLDPETTEECSICHAKCIEQWIVKNKTCPLCRDVFM